MSLAQKGRWVALAGLALLGGVYVRALAFTLLRGAWHLCRRARRVRSHERVPLPHASPAADRNQAWQARLAAGDARHTPHVVRCVLDPICWICDAALRHRRAARGCNPWLRECRKTPGISLRRTSPCRRS